MEFEVKVEKQAHFQEFLDEVTNKLKSMTGFKKTYQKFELNVTTSLKQVVIKHTDIYTRHKLLTCECTH